MHCSSPACEKQHLLCVLCFNIDQRRTTLNMRQFSQLSNLSADVNIIHDTLCMQFISRCFKRRSPRGRAYWFSSFWANFWSSKTLYLNMAKITFKLLQNREDFLFISQNKVSIYTIHVIWKSRLSDKREDLWKEKREKDLFRTGNKERKEESLSFWRSAKRLWSELRLWKF